MPYVLRELQEEHGLIWDKDKLYTNPEYSWLKQSANPASLIPAECLIDLQADGNELSFWYVESKDDQNIKRVGAALRAMRKSVKHFEYAILDVKVIQSANIELHETDGRIPAMSLKYLHRDITQLSVLKLLEFLVTIWDSVDTGIIFKEELESLIRDGIGRGDIADTKNAKVNLELRQRLMAK